LKQTMEEKRYSLEPAEPDQRGKRYHLELVGPDQGRKRYSLEPVESKDGEKNALFEQLDKIYHSDFWKVASFYYKFRGKISFAKVVHRFLQTLRKAGLRIVFKKEKKLLIEKQQDDKASPKEYDNDENDTLQKPFNPYDQVKLLKNINVSAIDVDFD